jgi:hypothetical protein
MFEFAFIFLYNVQFVERKKRFFFLLKSSCSRPLDFAARAAAPLAPP